MLQSVNFIAVIVSVLAAQVIGMTWYSTIFFGRTWFRLAFPGKRMEDMSMTKAPFVVNFIGSAIVSLICNYLINILAIKGLIDMVIVASVASSFNCALKALHGAFLQQPLGLFLIDGTFDFLLILSSCLISFLCNLKFCFGF
jgi:hypothetical protein